jgi:undecaprenyl-diphosphatase
MAWGRTKRGMASSKKGPQAPGSSSSTTRRWQRVIPSGKDELATLLTVLLLAGLTLTFGLVANEMHAGETRAFDNAIILAMRNPANHSDPIGPAWFEQDVLDISSLGSQAVVTIVSAATIGYLLLSGGRAAALLVFVAVVGGAELVTLLKQLFGRVRPDLVSHSLIELTRSFPSGHSALSAITYLTLGALVARVQTGHVLKMYVLGMAILLTVMIGLSRIYLAAHWPTDVLAGWSLGAAWAIACWLITRRLQRAGQVEPSIEG